jgi:hypothetical protein
MTAHASPYGLGCDAGKAALAMMQGRQDHLTSGVEWYRGFCQGCGVKPDPKVEAFIRTEMLCSTLGLAVRSAVEAFERSEQKP